jgi:hypothetical protein
MADYKGYLVSVELRPGAVTRTQPLRPCSGCSQCRDCKNEQLSVVPIHDKNKPSSSEDSDDDESISSEDSDEYHTDDTDESPKSENEAKRGLAGNQNFQEDVDYFYRDDNGESKLVKIVHVNSGDNPATKYTIEIPAHRKNVPGDRLSVLPPPHNNDNHHENDKNPYTLLPQKIDSPENQNRGAQV